MPRDERNRSDDDLEDFDEKSQHGNDRGSDDEDLKSREYTDKDGNIHHHTKKYQEGHDNE